ncbi:MAG: hypothetical protein MUE46_01605 [Xanthomonadales bacterium]|jgi:hypothetical protein|nr:hypothetical protein [Xanthomonadales bacterium]
MSINRELMLSQLQSLPEAQLSELIFLFRLDGVIATKASQTDRAIELIKAVESRGPKECTRLTDRVQTYCTAESPPQLGLMLTLPKRCWSPANSPPAALLRAEFGVVPFTGRVSEITALRHWIDTAASIALGLLTGPGGRGKTRLAIEAATLASTQGWTTGFSSASALVTLVDHLPDNMRVLVVIDYAEEDPSALMRALRSASARFSATTGSLRILLLARNAGEWFQQLQESRDLRDFFYPQRDFLRIRLTELAQNSDDGNSLFALARTAFREKLEISTHGSAQYMTTTARDALIIFTQALLVELGADLATDSNTRKSTYDPSDECDESVVLDYLLARESGFWHRALARHGLAESHWRLFEVLVAAVAYAGGTRNPTETEQLFRNYARKFEIDALIIEVYRLVLTATYGVDLGIESLQPDRLGERLMSRHAASEIIEIASFRATI